MNLLQELGPPMCVPLKQVKLPLTMTSHGKTVLKVNTSTRTILVTICSEGYFKAHFMFGDYFGGSK